jgi:hypothetical protein
VTVAVSCNLAEGVILGVDSAVTMENDKGQIVKTYENAMKLFQIGEKPIGIAVFGMGTLGNRSIGSYVREFELADPNKVVSGSSSVADVVEELRQFFLQAYGKVAVPEIEKRRGKKFDEIPDKEKPLLGLAVGGFSSGAYLSEVWEVLIPIHDKPGSPVLRRKQGDFGSNWFALNAPIFRYHKGYDRDVLNAINDYYAGLRRNRLTSAENAALEGVIGKYEYPIPFMGMPIDEGLAYVKFLVEMVINHHQFSVGAPVVGGKAQVGLVTYKGERFEILGG